MKTIFEVIKSNKETILTRGLIALCAVAGITVIGKVLSATAIYDEDYEDDDTEEDEDGEDFDE